jgi:hypothetical protein
VRADDEHLGAVALRNEIQDANSNLVRALISIIHRVTGILLALIVPFAGKRT